MSDHSPSPSPLSDDDLREVLDMVGTVLASVSDRMDEQTSTMDRLVKTATEARQAAFAAQKQTDPEQYGALISQAVEGKIADPLNHMVRVANAVGQQSRHTEKVLKKAEEDKWDVLNSIRERENQVDRVKRRLPWLALAAAVLALALTITLPRVSVITPTACGIFGGSWARTTEGNPACVFYKNLGQREELPTGSS